MNYNSSKKKYIYIKYNLIYFPFYISFSNPFYDNS